MAGTEQGVTAWRKSSYSGDNGGNCVEVGSAWRKSRHSGPNGGNCVEVGEGWRKSTHSSAIGDNCVEVGAAGPVVLVQDTKDRDAGTLEFGPAAWRRFTATVAVP